MALITSTQNSNMVFLEARQWKKTETSNPLTFVKLACADTFEQFEFMAERDCPVNFENKLPIVPTFKLGNYNGRASFQLNNLQVKK